MYKRPMREIAHSGIISLVSQSSSVIKLNQIYPRLRRSSHRLSISFKSVAMQKKTRLNKSKLTFSRLLRTSSSSNSKTTLRIGRRRESNFRRKYAPLRKSSALIKLVSSLNKERSSLNQALFRSVQLMPLRLRAVSRESLKISKWKEIAEFRTYKGIMKRIARR